MRRRPRLAALRVLGQRDFRVLLIGRTTASLGRSALPVALTFAVLDQLHSATALGLVLTAEAVPLVAFLVVGGLVADRWSRRRLMLGTDLVNVACTGAMAGLLLVHSATLWNLALLGVGTGTAGALFLPAMTQMVRETVPDDQLQEANTWRGIASSGAGMVGPARAGVLVAIRLHPGAR